MSLLNSDSEYLRNVYLHQRAKFQRHRIKKKKEKKKHYTFV